MKNTQNNSEIIYYNASITNNESFILNAETNDTRNQAIINNVEHWEMSVVRFDLNSTLMPPAIVPMPIPAVPPPFRSPTDLTFTMIYLGTIIQRPVLAGTYDYSGKSGFIFTYDLLLREFNATLALIFSLLPAGHAETTPPIFIFDPKTQLIKLYYEKAYSNVGAIELWCNSATHDKLYSIPVSIFAGYNQPNGMDFKIDFGHSSAINEPLLIAGVRNGLPMSTNVIPDPMLSNTQEVISTQSWNGVRAIILTTTSLPIQTEYLPNTTQASQQGSISSASAMIISDFLLSSETNPVADRIGVEYLPISEFRMISLVGNGSLSRISIQAFYQLTNGIILPVQLPPNGSFSVKIMFRKKVN